MCGLYSGSFLQLSLIHISCGDVIGAYFAHDHKNEYVGNYKGIDLGYAPGCGFNSYGNGGERAILSFVTCVKFCLSKNRLVNY